MKRGVGIAMMGIGLVLIMLAVISGVQLGDAVEGAGPGFVSGYLAAMSLVGGGGAALVFFGNRLTKKPKQNITA